MIDPTSPIGSKECSDEFIHGLAALYQHLETKYGQHVAQTHFVLFAGSFFTEGDKQNLHQVLGFGCLHHSIQALGAAVRHMANFSAETPEQEVTEVFKLCSKIAARALKPMKTEVVFDKSHTIE